MLAPVPGMVRLAGEISKNLSCAKSNKVVPKLLSNGGYNFHNKDKIYKIRSL